MPASTGAPLNLPYPLPAEGADGPGAIEALARALNLQIAPTIVGAVYRSQSGTSGVNGNVWINSTLSTAIGNRGIDCNVSGMTIKTSGLYLLLANARLYNRRGQTQKNGRVIIGRQAPGATSATVICSSYTGWVTGSCSPAAIRVTNLSAGDRVRYGWGQDAPNDWEMRGGIQYNICAAIFLGYPTSASLPDNETSIPTAPAESEGTANIAGQGESAP